MADGTLFHGISELLTFGEVDAAPEGPAWRARLDAGVGLVRDGAVLCGTDGRVVWAGAAADAPAAAESVDLGGAVVLPGMVDAHTHLIWAGDRTADFAARCAGKGYEDVAQAGGGIRLTVRATRAASLDALVEAARPRLRSLLSHGATTVEVKSGYGLSVADELKILEAIRRLDVEGPWRLVPTVLAAHVVPDEWRSDRAGYVSLITDELLPEVAARGLARHVDVFCDTGAFTRDEALTVLERGRELGFGLKVHAEQLSHTGISAAAADLGAVSADHLEHATPEDIRAMARSGTAAVLLPGADVFLGVAAHAPGRAMADAGVPVAVSTDCNPGTSPTTHLLLMATLACTLHGLRPDEALAGVTRAAATAVGLRDGTGTLVAGAPCDLVVCDVPGWLQLLYRMADHLVREVRVGGVRVWVDPEGRH